MALAAFRADAVSFSTLFFDLFAFYNSLYRRCGVPYGPRPGQDLEVSLVGGALFFIAGVS